MMDSYFSSSSYGRLMSIISLCALGQFVGTLFVVGFVWLHVTWILWREETCTVLVYYAVSSVNSLLTFQDNS